MTDPASPKETREIGLPPPSDVETSRRTGKDAQSREYSLDPPESLSPRLSKERAFSSPATTSSTPRSTPDRDIVFLSLGCPREDAILLKANGYEEIFQELLTSLPKEAAESILCAMISQEPYISEELRLKIVPERPPDGTSGVYFLKNFDGIVTSVFKPTDEEQYMEACPHYAMFSGEAPREPDYPVRLSVKKGRATQNEVACAEIAKNLFDLDAPETFFVAPTLIVHTNYLQVKARGLRPEKRVAIGPIALIRPDSSDFTRIPKPGSLQLFKKGVPAISFRSAIKIRSELIPSLYNTEEEALKAFERLYIFDLILGNTDRNLGNLLFDLPGRKMHPIDHGACIPDGLSLDAFQRRGAFASETMPLHFSIPIDDPATNEMREETKVFCSFIKPMLIEEILRKHFIPESAIQEMHLRVALLKAAISHNLNLTKIRSLFREARESKSDSAPSGNSPLLEIATKTVESLGIAKEAIPAEEEGKAALFTSFLEEFTRQANLYLESP